MKKKRPLKAKEQLLIKRNKNNIQSQQKNQKNMRKNGSKDLYKFGNIMKTYNDNSLNKLKMHMNFLWAQIILFL